MQAVRYGLISMLLLALGITTAAAENWWEIMGKPQPELIAILQDPNAPEFNKAKACQRLAYVGTKEAVPALAALLSDEKMNCYARYGLEGIRDASADAALRDAASKLQGLPLIGVLDSIGQCKDAQAVTLLTGFLADKDAAVASAAAGALGRIGNVEATTLLKNALAKDPKNTELADGCIMAASVLAASGKQPEAVAVLDAVTKAEVPNYVKAAAISCILRIRKGDAKDLLIAQILNPDKEFFNVGLAAARQMSGDEVTAILAGEFKKLPADRQALLLRVLGDRKESAPMALVTEACKSDSPEVREAAIIVLTKHGDASATSAMLEAALGDAQIADTAKEGLKALQGEKVDAAILERLANADARTKVVLFDILAARRVAAAAPFLREAVNCNDESLRLAALTALGKIAELNDIDLLADKAFAETATPELAAAKAALQMAAMRMSDRDVCAAKLSDRLEKASPDNKVFILDLLGKVSGSNALATVAAMTKTTDPEQKDAATRVLGSWISVEATPILLDLAKNDPEDKYQMRALRGYIRIARQLQLPAEAKLEMFRTAMDTAKRDEERCLALDILTRIPSDETLTLSVSHLSNPALKDAAADASVKIAAKILGQSPKAVADAMQKVVDAKAPEAVDARAKHLLNQANGRTK